MKRSLYYDTEQAFKDLGIALPPQLKKAKFCLGWATQAVRKPAMRSQFDGLRLPGSENPFELGELLAVNNFGLYLGQAIVSAYTHGMALYTVTKGGPGESPVQMHAHSAENVAALWDPRLRRLAAALTIAEYSTDKPKRFTVYLPDAVIECQFTKTTGWTAERLPNPIGRVLAVPITHDPQLRRQFGRSRLTNSVMGLTDMAARSYVRMEGNAELYSAPQLALLGVDEAAYEDMSETRRFKLAMRRLLAITKDEDGDTPSLQQLTQASMTPHSDMLRTIAMAFTGETGIPPSSLGVLHDNPASAEAIRAAEHDLLIDATYQNKYVLSAQVRDLMILTVMVRDTLTEEPADWWKLTTRFADPEFRSQAAGADAVQKLSASMDQLVKHPVLLEQVFDEGQVQRILDDQRRARGSNLVDNLLGQAPGSEPEPATTDAPGRG
nr:phage portal protein [Brevibacterium sp. 91QC2O2]